MFFFFKWYVKFMLDTLYLDLLLGELSFEIGL